LDLNLFLKKLIGLSGKNEPGALAQIFLNQNLLCPVIA